MSDRQMFVVQGSASVPAEAVSLSDLHLREVSEIEEEGGPPDRISTS